MSCGFDREIIQKYADNTIDPLEFIFLREHINYCGECRKELDLSMTLENELNKFFDDDSGVKDMDIMITRLVEDCMSGLNKREKLKYALNRARRIGRGIMDNSLKFTEYIPGRKAIGKGAQKTALITGNFVKSIVKKEIKKLIYSFR